MNPTFIRLPLVILLLATAITTTLSQSQPTKDAPKVPTVSWPTQPIKLLVGFPAGSVQDISARIIAEPLSQSLGQPVIVENKVGASGSIAAAQVAKATDGHTFGVMNNSQLTIAKILNPAITYDPETDLAPIALIGTTPMVMVISNAAEGKSRAEWLTWLRNQGSKANYGSPGIGTPGHLGMELIKSRSGGLMAVHIPYPGNPQVISAILGGQVQMALLPPGLAMQQVRAGKMRAVGITTDNRSALAPDIPTLREAGINGADVELITALAGPASISLAVRDKLSAAVLETGKSEETRRRYLTAGWQPSFSNAVGLFSRIHQETRKLGGIIMMFGIRSDS